MALAPIAFVTDYGVSDTYAAALHAAVWRVDPSLAALVGMHAVPPGDVLAGAYHVKAMALAMPPGGVVCAVVDPGVGTARRALAAVAGDRFFVLPDNGLISYAWEESPPASRECVALPVPDGASATFHGRDVFAPAAARLATGTPLGELGIGSAEPRLLDTAFAHGASQVLTGVVCVVDHFGNAVTTIRDRDLGGRRVVAAEWDGDTPCSATPVRTYAGIREGGLGVLLGSAGHLEVAARGGRAEALGGPALGAAVRVHLGEGAA